MTIRRIIISFTLFFIVAESFAQQPLPPIGQWREHLPYQSAIDVTTGSGKVYAATPYSIFSVDLAENSVERMSRMTGLSETGVSHIYYSTVNDKLLIAYNTSNIDILYRNDVFNIPDIKQDNIVGDKTIYNIYAAGKYFYLSTGLGVVVVDADKYEVNDSWFIGNSGGKVKVNGFNIAGGFFYAATEEGLKRTPVGNANPANYLNWENLSGVNGLSAGVCDDVIYVNDKLIVSKSDSLYIMNGNSWTFFFVDAGWQIGHVSTSSGKILVCQVKNDGSAKLTVLNTDGSVASVIQQQNQFSLPRNAILLTNNYWIADENKGLVKYNAGGFENYRLNSPLSIASGEITVKDNTLLAASGEVNSLWVGQKIKNGFYKFSDGQWANYSKDQFPVLDSLPDLITIASENTDGSIWAGSFGGGLLHFSTNNSVEVFKQNSPVGEATANPGNYLVSGLLFDDDGNLWISNYGATNNFLVRKHDGSWKSFSAPFVLSENALSQITIDDANQKWIVSPKGNGVLCFNDGETIDNAADDKWKLYRSGSGNGNLPSNNILSVAKDKNGFIWIGTDDGVAIVQCPQIAFTPQGCDAFLPVVNQGGFNNYLFKGEEVQCIAVDGGDRKWVGTKNGAWLISPEGDKVIFRFTEENSVLLSNDVRKIAIDSRTGEIYFATAKGICSFRSTATEGGEKNEDVLVFPNPVPPGYGGTIAIRGLVNNAIVKITEMDGRLVYQTRALGGQAVWDGKDYKGGRIASGIYLVLVSDDGRKENIAAKIVFISK